MFCRHASTGKSANGQKANAQTQRRCGTSEPATASLITLTQGKRGRANLGLEAKILLGLPEARRWPFGDYEF